MLKTAYIEQEQGNQIEARILLQEIIQFHPRSNAAISAGRPLPTHGREARLHRHRAFIPHREGYVKIPPPAASRAGS